MKRVLSVLLAFVFVAACSKKDAVVVGEPASIFAEKTHEYYYCHIAPTTAESSICKAAPIAQKDWEAFVSDITTSTDLAENPTEGSFFVRFEKDAAEFYGFPEMAILQKGLAVIEKDARVLHLKAIRKGEK